MTPEQRKLFEQLAVETLEDLECIDCSIREYVEGADLVIGKLIEARDSAFETMKKLGQ